MDFSSSNKVCSEHLEKDNNVKFVESQIRRLKYVACQSLLSWSIRSHLREKPTVLHCQYSNYGNVLASTFHCSVSLYESPLTYNRLILLTGTYSLQNSPNAIMITIYC